MIRRTFSQLMAWLDSRSFARKKPREHATVRIGVELLEDRITPSAGAREQYMLELINRMRENPAAELPILLNSGDASVDSALEYFNVNRTVLQNQWNNLVPAPPLAWNDNLALAARNHNQAMLSAGVQSHQVAGEASLGNRITSAGYANWSSLGENIYAYADSIFAAHAAFAIDWGNTSTGIQDPPGHRLNIMSTGFRDIGIGVLDAPASSALGPLLITQDFGNRFSYGNPFLLGVVYNDANVNGFYDQGEGLSGVSLTVTGSSGTSNATTTAFGGYQLQLGAGSYTITASGGGLFAPITRDVTIGSSNVRVNLVRGTVPQQDAAIPFSDDFNRSNSSFAGAYYRTIQGNVGISNNALVGAGAISVATLNGVSLADTTVQADIVVNRVSGQQAGLIARFSGAGNHYHARIRYTGAGFVGEIYKFAGGAWALLATSPVSTGTGTIRFEVIGTNLKLYFGANASAQMLVAYAYDSALAAGTTGVRVSAGVALDNFTTNSVAVPTSQTLPFSDSFAANPSAQQLGSSWQERSGNFSVASGAAVAVGSSTSVATVSGIAVADVAVQGAIVVGPTRAAGLIARYQTNGSYYLGQVVSNGSVFNAVIYKFKTGTGFTRLNAVSTTFTFGVGVLRFEVIGTSLKLFFGPDANNLRLGAYAFDATIGAAGQTGIRALKNAAVDDFTTLAIAPTTPSLPFSDAFAQADGSQLTRNWTERQGNFSVSAGVLVANDSLINQATVHGASLADAAVQADFNVRAGQVSGLMARYQSNGSYYLAHISANSHGTVFTATIYKYTSGRFTLLSSTTLATGTGTIRFEVAGSSLRLYFGSDATNLSLVTTAMDSSITAAGLVGIRAGKNATLGNFSASQI